jgi:thiol-disulfide isomerase/thioredoxin
MFESLIATVKMTFASLFLASSAQVSGPAATPLPAPDFTGISHWLNSEPKSLSKLRGQVVLVDFWTYTCINCIHTLPYVKQWDQKYRDQGLTVVGVHTPEFPIERQTENVAQAIKRFGIQYAVAQDNDYATWDAYRNRYWPALYLIDKQGNIVYRHFGEGNYKETEAEIQRLLAQP